MLFLFVSCALAGQRDTINYSNGKIFIGGRRANRQIFIEQHGGMRQITHFSHGETIWDLQLSPNELWLLFRHIPIKHRANRFAVVDLTIFKLSKSVMPGVMGALYWTKNNTILWLYKNFRLYDPHLNVLVEPTASILHPYIESDFIVSSPQIDPEQGYFQVWSLKDGRLLNDKSFVNKYGMYDCKSVNCINGVLTVQLWLRDKDTVVVDTLKY